MRVPFVLCVLFHLQAHDFEQKLCPDFDFLHDGGLSKDDLQTWQTCCVLVRCDRPTHRRLQNCLLSPLFFECKMNLSSLKNGFWQPSHINSVCDCMFSYSDETIENPFSNIFAATDTQINLVD